MAEVGKFPVNCPVCSQVIKLSVSCEIVNDDKAHLGEARLTCEPDMTDIWAHMWVHNARPADSDEIDTPKTGR